MQEAEACRALLLHSGMQVCYELMCSMVHNHSTAKKGPFPLPTAVHLWHICQHLWHIYINVIGSYNANNSQSARTLAALMLSEHAVQSHVQSGHQ